MSKQKKKTTLKQEDAKTQAEASEPTLSVEEQLKQQQELVIRLQAEFANFKRRTDEQLANSMKLGVAKALKAIINILDDFSLALQTKQSGEDYHKGMEMIYAKLVSTGEELGLKKIEAVGNFFDPNKHEALLAEVSDRPEQEVLQELQPGYEFNGTTLRTTKVKVAKK